MSCSQPLLEIRERPGEGRAAIAAADIPAGTLLLEVSPVAFLVSPSVSRQVCHWCLVNITEIAPAAAASVSSYSSMAAATTTTCDDCGATFCSVVCRSAAGHMTQSTDHTAAECEAWRITQRLMSGYSAEEVDRLRMLMLMVEVHLRSTKTKRTAAAAPMTTAAADRNVHTSKPLAHQSPLSLSSIESPPSPSMATTTTTSAAGDDAEEHCSVAEEHNCVTSSTNNDEDDGDSDDDATTPNNDTPTTTTIISSSTARKRRPTKCDKKKNKANDKQSKKPTASLKASTLIDRRGYATECIASTEEQRIRNYQATHAVELVGTPMVTTVDDGDGATDLAADCCMTTADKSSSICNSPLSSLVTNLGAMPKSQLSRFGVLFKLYEKALAVAALDAASKDAASSPLQPQRKNTRHHPPRFVFPLCDIDTFMRLCGALQCNGFGVWSSKELCLGTAIYPMASFFNHSCNPSVCRQQHTTTFPQQEAAEGNFVSSAAPLGVGSTPRVARFYALRKIEAGEPLCISYVDLQARPGERRKQLLTNYCFACGCERCANESTALCARFCTKCPGHGYLRPLVATKEGAAMLYVCTLCGARGI